MAYDAYLRLRGKSQGDIKGAGNRTGRKGLIKVISWHHDIAAPRDPASGLPTGRRQHQPFVITKEVDCASPLLLSALAHNELLPEWELTLWQRTASGKDVPYYSIRLTNAAIAHYHGEMPDNQTEASHGLHEREQFAFTYEKIEWSHLAAGVTAADDWSAPVA